MKKMKREWAELPFELGGLGGGCFSEKVTHGQDPGSERSEQQALGAFQKYKKATMAWSRELWRAV